MRNLRELLMIESASKEAFDKKREQIREESREKFMTKLTKIENARKRKHDVVENIRKSIGLVLDHKKKHQNKNKRMIDRKINQVVKLISNVNDEDWGNKKAYAQDDENRATNKDNSTNGQNDSTSSDEDELSIHKKIWKVLKPQESDDYEMNPFKSRRPKRPRSISPSNESTIMNIIKQEILDQLESKSTEHADMGDDNSSQCPRVVATRDRTNSYNGCSVSEIYGTLALFDIKGSNRFSKIKNKPSSSKIDEHNHSKPNSIKNGSIKSIT
jgi:hypothetical protein